MNSKSVDTYTVEVHYDPKHGFEAAVQELPGCFAAGYTTEQLQDSLEEAIGLYLSEKGHRVRVQFADEAEPKPVVRRERRKVEVCYT